MRSDTTKKYYSVIIYHNGYTQFIRKARLDWIETTVDKVKKEYPESYGNIVEEVWEMYQDYPVHKISEKVLRSI